MSLMDTIKGWFGKGKDQAANLTDQAKDLANTDVGKKVEDQVEKQADKGGTIGQVADAADDQIDKVQGTQD
jgi:hypothetical protein